MLVYCTPSITKNVFTMLHCSPTPKIFSTTTWHSIHYESQEAPFCVKACRVHLKLQGPRKTVVFRMFSTG
jgi:hypothetical protein